MTCGFKEIQNTFNVNLTPIENLSINAQYSYDLDNRYNKTFISPWTLYFPNWDTAVDTTGDGFINHMELTPAKRAPEGVGTPQNSERYDRGIRGYGLVSADYSRNFGDHYISMFGGFEEITTEANNIYAFRRDYISDVVQTLDAGGRTGITNSGGLSMYARRSYIGRFSYNYMGKYLSEITFRRDGSLKYSPETRWGNFPSFLIGWLPSEEDFWNVSFINYLKLRASYGKLGMDPGSPFQYLTEYRIVPGNVLGDKTIQTGVEQIGVANPLITWEKEDIYNIGFETGFLDYRLNLEVDFFYKYRYDILASRDASIPHFTGISLPQENIAEVDNRGFEIIARYNETFGQNFRLNLTGNISYTKNKVIFMDEPTRVVPWQVREDRPFGAVLMYNAIGVFADQDAVDSYPHWPGAKPGDIIFEDVNNDGKIDAQDRILLDKTDEPRTIYGLSLDLAYKNWSLFILAQGVGEFYTNPVQEADNVRGLAGNHFRFSYDNRWTLGELPGVEKNIHTDVPRIWNRGDEYWNWRAQNNSYWWVNTAYCRLKSMTLSYRLPKTVFGEHLGISRANIYVIGDNLFLIYNASKHFDPEVPFGEDYPITRSISVGVNVIF